MTALQLWMLAGMLSLGGVACLVWYLVPAEPDLGDVLVRLAPNGQTRRVDAAVADKQSLTTRVGLWAVRHLPARLLRTPIKDLALVGKPVHVFYGEKLLVVAAVVVGVPALSAVWQLMFSFPLYVPLIVTVVAATLAWFLPDQAVKETATKARQEFNEALGAYVDLVALERKAGGSGIRQAMESAAAVGDSWPFRRIADALARSGFAGIGPWDALHDLAQELNLPSLDELAGIMQLAGEESSQVYDTLKMRSSALRTALLTAEQAKANAAGERMTVPITMMTIIFTAIVITPALFRLLAG